MTELVITQAMLDSLEVGQQFDTQPLMGGFGKPVTWTVNRVNTGVEYLFDLRYMGVALCSVAATIYEGEVIMEEI